jgi:hypothetical protein
MIYPSCLKSYTFRHAISVGVAVVIAVIVNTHFSYSRECWILVVAFLVSQTTRGTPLRQGMVFFLFIILALWLSAFLLINVKQGFILDSILAGVIIVSGTITFINRPLANKLTFLVLFFPLVLLLATLAPYQSEHLVFDRMIAAVIGAVIGILCAQFVLPVRYDKEFRQALLPLLQVLSDYSRTLKACFQPLPENKNRRWEKKLEVEKWLQESYPEWVYEVGFNPGLRRGFRFFLVNLERITDIFFSMNYLISQGADNILSPKEDQRSRQDLSNAIANSMQKNEELFAILAEYFASNQLKNIKSDFTSDITELENTLRLVVPRELELLDISPDYVTLTALVRDIKDMRNLLLQLIMALPPMK